MNKENGEPGQAGWFSRLIAGLIRVIFTIFLGIALGAGIYFGAIALYHRLIQPVQANSAKMIELESRLDSLEGQYTERSSDLVSRLGAQEVRIDRLRADYDQSLERVSALENDQTAMINDLENWNKVQADLQSQLDALIKEAASIQTEIDDLSDTITSNEDGLKQIEADWKDKYSVIAAIDHKLQILKTIELLTRSRYNLVQNNLGLAEQDIQSGHELLVNIKDELPEYQLDAFNDILDRFESALANLPGKPVAAAEDVESAWNLLLSGLPDQLEESASAQISQTPLSNATPNPESTPSP